MRDTFDWLTSACRRLDLGHAARLAEPAEREHVPHGTLHLLDANTACGVGIDLPAQAVERLDLGYGIAPSSRKVRMQLIYSRGFDRDRPIAASSAMYLILAMQ